MAPANVLMIVALPALEVPEKVVEPPAAPANVPLLLVIVALPALDVSKKVVEPTAVPPLMMLTVGYALQR